MDDETYAFGGYAAKDAAIEDALECRECEGDARECGHNHPYNVRAMARLGLA